MWHIVWRHWIGGHGWRWCLLHGRWPTLRMGDHLLEGGQLWLALSLSHLHLLEIG
jgi:hypothetical protein